MWVLLTEDDVIKGKDEMLSFSFDGGRWIEVPPDLVGRKAATLLVRRFRNSSQIDYDLERVMPQLREATGWREIDHGVLKGDLGGGFTSVLVVYPSLVSYDGVTEVWFKCRFRIPKKDGFLFDNLIDWFTDTVFPRLKLRPFKDEDAKRGHFSYRRMQDDVEVAFFLNPDYPEGRWSNHAIECA